MNQNKRINVLINEALNSVDNINRGSPKPFLLTRIYARMNHQTESRWEKIGWFIGRPAIAFLSLCIFLVINVLVLVLNKTSAQTMPIEQITQTPADEFSYTVATIYDLENTQP